MKNKEATKNKKIEEENMELVLRQGSKGLELKYNGQVLRADLMKMLPRLKQNNLHGELIVKASRIKDADHSLTAVDATAGFGEDSLLLAAAGFSVRLYESNPYIAALLKDALERAEEAIELKDIVSRMQLFEANSIEEMPKLIETPDVILLDPMFPDRQKNSLVKKKFQFIHQLEPPCVDEKKLFEAAMKVKPRKIVIKRPLKGSYLANIKPSYSIRGKSIRYDCIVLP